MGREDARALHVSMALITVFALAGVLLLAVSFAGQDSVNIDVTSENQVNDEAAYGGSYTSFINQSDGGASFADYSFEPQTLEDWRFAPQIKYEASSATRYASPGGANTGEGTNRNNPVSVNRAIAIAQPGDVIYLLEGTYSQQVNFSNLKGTKDSPIVFASEYGKPRSAVISHGELHIARLNNSSYVTLDSLVFDGENSSIWGLMTGTRYAGDQKVGYNQNIAFIGNEIRQVGVEAAINITQTDGAVIFNNYVHSTRPQVDDPQAQGEGIYLGCGACPASENTEVTNIQVLHNKVQDVGGEGIEVKMGVNNVVISDNLILDSGWRLDYVTGCCFGGGIVIHFIRPAPTLDSNILIERNRVGRGAYWGYSVGAGNAIVRDNLAWEPGKQHRHSTINVSARPPYATQKMFFNQYNNVTYENNYAAAFSGAVHTEDLTYGNTAVNKPNFLKKEFIEASSTQEAFNSWRSTSF